MTKVLTLAGYVIIAVAIIAAETRARRLGTATFGHALAMIMRTRIGRVVILAGWLWLGWHLFVRVGER
jgi:Family of unknown function (DUF6186)